MKEAKARARRLKRFNKKKHGYYQAIKRARDGGTYKNPWGIWPVAPRWMDL